ncbi:MAG: hypothetical protein C0595_13530 [Marinilabiliales bacterium]|nr:MAG: hypothetical protein C0595_13530 [Marinilabiliales bacterium]
MKKTALIPLLLMVIIITISSCNNKNNEDNTIKKNYAWVVGAVDSTGYGLILFSKDGGETWSRQAENNEALKGIEITNIWAVDENNVWAIGLNNTILTTNNGGDTWTKVTNTPQEYNMADLMDISITNKTNIWISGSEGNQGIVYYSNDNGNNWKVCDSSFFDNTFPQGVLALDNQNAYIVGAQNNNRKDRGFIAYTNDGGESWDSIEPADNYNKWEWIGAVSSGNTIVINGDKSRYLVSNDGGSTWLNDSILGTGGEDGADINDLIMLDSKVWWGAFDMGQIYITVDGGKNWIKQETPDLGGTFLLGIDAYDNYSALAVSSVSSWPPVCPIIKTNNGGATWERKYTLYSSLNKVSFIKD